MIRWIPYTFVRIVLFFITGIITGIYCPDVLPGNSASAVFLISAMLYFIGTVLIWNRKSLKDHRDIKFATGFIGLITIFLAGYLQLLKQTENLRNDHIALLEHPVEFYKAVLIHEPAEKPNSWKAEGSIEWVKSGDEWIKSRGKILLYFSKTDFQKSFHYGDVFLVKGNPQDVPSPANPEEFDYKRFLRFRNIFHQHFLRKDDVMLLSHTPPSLLFNDAMLCRRWAVEKLLKYVQGDREQGIVTALVLGTSDGLDNELLKAYAATGAMHVLSVSGLHVGVIYGLLLLILKPLNRTPSGKWILAMVSVFMLWLYAFITGLSPSVLRAVTMFSFVALARPAARQTNIYNTLAASAFMLLLYDPNLVMSVGFQLSYLAVAGIVYIHPMLYRLWEPDKKLITMTWEVTSISIAAQIATCALGLLYFHQFPNYFILSNLLVIPTSSAALITGMGVLTFNFISPVASLLGYLLEWMIRFMNWVVFTIESFPFSLIDNIYISPMQCWILMGMTISLLLLLQYRKLNYAFMITGLIVFYSALQWTHFSDTVNKSQITVYSVKGHTAMDLMESGRTYFFSDSTLQQDEDQIRFHIRPNRIFNGTREIINGEAVGLTRALPGCRILCWKDKRILQITKKEFVLPQTLQVDYVMIENNAVRDLRLLRDLNFKKVILDGNNSSYHARKIMRQADELNIKMHSVLQDGAFIITI